ncbi:DUF3467 domain-containing protein [Mesobacterium sp. TK19101]|uniref:DUF3467 domain-containing protein n=1 Tax=Mesobacterium hydrothermale TaxID=3111907 RepID=A0ABU6HLN3_9RHOB|nr:DUF3467 domain-containing protein [Mesobacterium sp. TK19101]MEC3862809.1 DUF3467 domain-containing protein [Mesobacterium sp. TK19101]
MAKAAEQHTADKTETVAAKPEANPNRAATVPPHQVKFETENLKSSYCNVCNGSSTREEVVVNFGVNESWDLGEQQLRVKLEHRVVMAPHAAKRLRDMLVRLIDEHEKRYGPLGD